MLADISQGHTGFADIMFLVAFILALVAGGLTYVASRLAPAVLSFAVAAVALGFLVL